MTESDRRTHAQHAARRRLQWREQAAFAWLTEVGAAVNKRSAVLDSARYAAPLHERLDARDRVHILLWGSALIVLGCMLVSFFSQPLMDYGLAMTALFVGALLILSYLV